MNRIFYSIFLLLTTVVSNAQTITNVIKAGFGVEADLRANFYNNFAQSGNDDWFSMSSGAGAFVIDTTGAAAITTRYATDLNFRKLPFFRTMKYPAYSVVNNKLLLDAVFIRDYHGEDSTIFASGASKNGESPQFWSCPVAQSVPDKNEILDMMVHVRRAGPTPTDSLWMFGGLSIENTNGDRYFDFEMYQTDIYYDRGTQKFYGYGPDAGHTSWTFDASGNVLVPGDIIFSASYGSSTLSSIEARIWVNKNVLTSVPNPAGFTWSGSFDGASNGAQYGYAGITPKTSGIFYTGVESLNNTWAGPFQLVRGDNVVVTNYTAGQFMEFSVNLTKLGLDPVTLLGNDECGMPFRRVLVKSRASTSFTSALKDFVGPFDFFLPSRVDIQANQSVLCGLILVSDINVINPVPTSTYLWSTTDGHIIGSTIGTSITVDAPGTYIVKQYLQAGCSVYATDTVKIFYNSSCFVLDNNLLRFSGKTADRQVNLNWTMNNNASNKFFEIERSVNGIDFEKIARVEANLSQKGDVTYIASDHPGGSGEGIFYYRIKIVNNDGYQTYSKIVNVSFVGLLQQIVKAAPNPVKDFMNISITSLKNNPVEIMIYDGSGRLIKRLNSTVTAGVSNINISDCKRWKAGFYTIKTSLGEDTFTEKIFVVK